MPKLLATRKLNQALMRDPGYKPILKIGPVPSETAVQNLPSGGELLQWGEWPSSRLHSALTPFCPENPKQKIVEIIVTFPRVLTVESPILHLTIQRNASKQKRNVVGD